MTGGQRSREKSARVRCARASASSTFPVAPGADGVRGPRRPAIAVSACGRHTDWFARADAARARTLLAKSRHCVAVCERLGAAALPFHLSKRREGLGVLAGLASSPDELESERAEGAVGERATRCLRCEPVQCGRPARLLRGQRAGTHGAVAVR